MASTDQSDKPDAGGDPASGLADDVKQLLDQLAAQITDADQRHSDSVHDMQERLANLTDRATAAKSTLPEGPAKALERVEDAMAALASRLAHVESAPPPEGPASHHHEPETDETSLALPDEVRAEVRRAMYEKPKETGEAPPALRSALAGAGKSTRTGSDEPPARLPAEDTLEGNSPPAPTPSPLDKGWDNPSAPPPFRAYRTSTPTPLPGATTSETPAADRAWLEERFADIAGRVEHSLSCLDPHNSLLSIGARFDQLERRFDSALGQLASPVAGDTTALKAIEKQITDIFSELDRAQKQLGRLDKIESRLSELRQSPSEEQMTRLIGAMSPNDKHLAAVAEAAAERVAEHLRSAVPAAPHQAVDDPRLGELTTLLRDFIEERRQGDAHNAEALDTMQLAMQHIIDRVEAIEAAQAIGHAELMRTAQPSAARRTERAREPLELGVRDSNLTPAAVSSGSDELPRFAGAETAEPPGAGTLDQPQPAAEAPRFDHAPSLTSQEPTVPTIAGLDHIDDKPLADIAAPGSDNNRQAMIAMARRAADRAMRASSAPASAAADAGPGGPLAWVRRLAGITAANDQPRTARRPRVLLVASFAAFLLAGFWMFAGTGLRGMVPGSGSERPVPAAKQQGTSEGTPAATGTATRSAVRSHDEEPASTDHRKSAGEIAPGRFPPVAREPDATAQPAMVRVSDGIVVDHGYGVVGSRAQRGPIQTASLTPQPTPAQATAPAVGDAAVRSVEMPPALIGPLSLRQAAANGDAAAQLEIGNRFAEGKGVPKDFGHAATWYQRAAAHGLATAQYRLGNLYERGLGVPPDPARARVWYGRAAAQGNVRAMHNLAVLSASSAEGRPDYPGAVQWFSEAAGRGLADSQYNLGILHESGLGVPVGLAEAYKWYALAARSGDKDAIRRRDAVRSRLDTASVKAADRLVITWRPKPVEPTANDGRSTGHIGRIN